MTHKKNRPGGLRRPTLPLDAGEASSMRRNRTLETDLPWGTGLVLFSGAMKAPQCPEEGTCLHSTLANIRPDGFRLGGWHLSAWLMVANHHFSSCWVNSPTDRRVRLIWTCRAAQQIGQLVVYHCCGTVVTPITTIKGRPL
jgi:hypothetical protein